ncbi:hypothetical protein A6U87_21315 [Rhizobium sp. AC44/96]|nr:hypothetical protein A6U87_21315 [Rhizobium sp. AC44/96]
MSVSSLRLTHMSETDKASMPSQTTIIYLLFLESLTFRQIMPVAKGLAASHKEIVTGLLLRLHFQVEELP